MTWFQKGHGRTATTFRKMNWFLSLEDAIKKIET